jgi:hypothetical protein
VEVQDATASEPATHVIGERGTLVPR